MSVFSFVFLIIVTIIINIFITAFLIARSQYSQKVIEHLRCEAQSIIRTVNKATEEHVSVAESTIAELKNLLGMHRPYGKPSGVRRGQKPVHEALVNQNSVLSEQDEKNTHSTTTKKSTNILLGGAQNTVLNMLADGKSETYIREHFAISKAELALAKVMYKNKKGTR